MKLFCIASLFVIANMALPVHAQSFKPEQLRTSFLHHIVHYATYPQGQITNNDIGFCFYEGPEKSHISIFQSLPAKKLKNSKTVAIEIENIADINTQKCQLLFVSRQVESSELFLKLQEWNKSMVSVGETRDFVERGGLITIVPLQSKMKIFLSRKQYENSGLKFSSLLLQRVNFR